MQRPERERKEPTEFNVIVKAKDLVKHTFTITNSTERYPKKYRFTLVNRIQDRHSRKQNTTIKGRCIPSPLSTAGTNTGSPIPEHTAFRRLAKVINSEDFLL